MTAFGSWCGVGRTGLWLLEKYEPPAVGPECHRLSALCKPGSRFCRDEIEMVRESSTYSYSCHYYYYHYYYSSDN